MATILIKCEADSDAMVIAEVARRFGCEVDFRFGNLGFLDDAAGNSTVVQAEQESPRNDKASNRATHKIDFGLSKKIRFTQNRGYKNRK